MAIATRTATVQMRVTPAVKYASEEVLQRLGMSMTEAMELFLRRVIVDQRIPFEIVALDPETIERITTKASVCARPKIITHRRAGKRGRYHTGGG